MTIKVDMSEVLREIADQTRYCARCIEEVASFINQSDEEHGGEPLITESDPEKVAKIIDNIGKINGAYYMLMAITNDLAVNIRTAFPPLQGPDAQLREAATRLTKVVQTIIHGAPMSQKLKDARELAKSLDGKPEEFTFQMPGKGKA